MRIAQDSIALPKCQPRNETIGKYGLLVVLAPYPAKEVPTNRAKVEVIFKIVVASYSPLK